MNGKIMVIVAAVFGAGLFVSFAPAIVPDIAAGRVEDSSLVLPNIGTIERFAAMWAPVAAAGKKIVQGRRQNNEWGSRIIPNRDWPYCDPACLKANQHDRLPQESVVKKNRTLSPSTETSPLLKKPVPFGCDPAFSPVADPVRAHIYRRCMA